ncbi:hypothetical protein GCM10010236_20940 [Streptomyces eurythermus]|nr:hypothetical protein GCM10010236_20940 [Streptomyces eurythermus]
MPALPAPGKRRHKGVVTLYGSVLSGTVTALGGAPLPGIRPVTITPDATSTHPHPNGSALVAGSRWEAEGRST